MIIYTTMATTEYDSMTLVMTATTNCETTTDTTQGRVTTATSGSETMTDTMTVGLVMPMTTGSEMRKATVGARLRNTKYQSTKPTSTRKMLAKRRSKIQAQKTGNVDKKDYICADCT